MKRIALLALVALLVLPATAALAQVDGATTAAPAGLTPEQFVEGSIGRGLAILGLGIGLGLIILGAGKGIGNIGGHATEAIARQPEAGGRIFTTMIISAALIEGAALFAIVAFIIK